MEKTKTETKTKTFYAARLNQNLGKYLAFTNIKNTPATASQAILDYAVFFETEDLATSAIEAYLNSPNCKMAKENNKFISVVPIKFEYDFKTFPFSSYYKMIDTTGLKDAKNNCISGVHLEYNGFFGRCFICTRAYSCLASTKRT